MTEIFVKDMRVLEATRTQDIGRYVTCKPLIEVRIGAHVTVTDRFRQTFSGQVTELFEDGSVTLDTMVAA